MRRPATRRRIAPWLKAPVHCRPLAGSRHMWLRCIWPLSPIQNIRSGAGRTHSSSGRAARRSSHRVRKLGPCRLRIVSDTVCQAVVGFSRGRLGAVSKWPVRWISGRRWHPWHTDRDEDQVVRDRDPGWVRHVECRTERGAARSPVRWHPPTSCRNLARGNGVLGPYGLSRRCRWVCRGRC